MHMADALLSPAVGGVMTAISVSAIGYSVKKIANEKTLDEKKIPIMGVMGAFVFAGQMINFSIPGTGSSGHIGGGILLAAILGGYPALITIASVLLIQCLFFADGGLLAYGSNLFNMGVVTCLIVYPLIFKPIAGRILSKARLIVASIVSVVVGLQLGAFFVVLETLISGVTELPFNAFVLLMQPIHLAIGLVEGLVTAAVLCFVASVRPEILESAARKERLASTVSVKKFIAIFAVLAVLIGGGLSLFASTHPDGLEWSMNGVAGTTELERADAVHEAAGSAVEKTALMPDYDATGTGAPSGTAIAGIVGSLITVVLAGGAGLVIWLVRRRKPRVTS